MSPLFLSTLFPRFRVGHRAHFLSFDFVCSSNSIFVWEKVSKINKLEPVFMLWRHCPVIFCRNRKVKWLWCLSRYAKINRDENNTRNAQNFRWIIALMRLHCAENKRSTELALFAANLIIPWKMTYERMSVRLRTKILQSSVIDRTEKGERNNRNEQRRMFSSDELNVF